MKARVSLKDFINDCLWEQFFASNSAQNSSNLISLKILVTPRPVTLFQIKISAIQLQNKC